MMLTQSEKVIDHYADAYRKLYKRIPKDLQILDNEWVIVNGARMRVAELEYLTKQLQQEYTQGMMEKRSVVMRLLNWLKN